MGKIKHHLSKNEKNLYGALIILVLVATLYFSLFVNDYTGKVAQHDAEAGTVTEIVITDTTPTSYWNGFFGAAVTDSSYNNLQSDVATPAGMEENNLIFSCFQPGIAHEVYATTMNPTTMGSMTMCHFWNIKCWSIVPSRTARV